MCRGRRAQRQEQADGFDMSSEVNRQETQGLIDRIEAGLANRRPRIVVLGDIMLDDYLIGPADRISPEAPIPVVACKEQNSRPGGAANVAANLVSLGGDVSLVAVIGRDMAGEQLVKALQDLGIATTHLAVAAGRVTTRKMRVVASGQQIVRVDFEETGPLGDTIDRELLSKLEAALAGCQGLVVSDYKKGVCERSVVQRAIAIARKHSIPVFCDPKGKDYTKYAGASMITPNRREASEALGRDLTTSDDLNAGAGELRNQLGLEACLITLGSDGMLLLDETGASEIHSLAQDVADVTGAGDSVIAALALARGCGLTYEESCLFANEAAAVAVSRRGGVAVTMDDIRRRRGEMVRRNKKPKFLTREELPARLREIRRLGNRIVFTNGCFDILHAGHIHNLEKCAELGSFLIVGLNSDASVRRLKGPGRPVNDLKARASVLAALSAVDWVVSFDEDTPDQLIREARPDILAKGSDYRGQLVVGQEFVESYGGTVALVDLQPGFSTTSILAKASRAGA